MFRAKHPCVTTELLCYDLADILVAAARLERIRRSRSSALFRERATRDHECDSEAQRDGAGVEARYMYPFAIICRAIYVFPLCNCDTLCSVVNVQIENMPNY